MILIGAVVLINASKDILLTFWCLKRLITCGGSAGHAFLLLVHASVASISIVFGIYVLVAFPYDGTRLGRGSSRAQPHR